MASRPGIRLRHARSCAGVGGRCKCSSWEASVFSVADAKKIRRTFPSEASARAWRADALSLLNKGALRAPAPETLDEAAAVWIEGARRGEVRTRSGTRYKPAALRNYDRDLTRYVLPSLGELRLATLARRDVQKLVDRLVADGKTGSKVRQVLMPLRAICRRAIENDELIVNPTVNLRLPALEGGRDHVATSEEAAAILDALPVTDRALWATAFYAGLRRGELRALRWSDVDLDAGDSGVITVSRGWDDIEGEIDPKSKKGTRRVPIPARLRIYLLEHRALTGRRGDDLVFGRTASLPFFPNAVAARAEKAWGAAAVGAFLQGRSLDPPIEKLGLHEARHTYVSLMFDAGLPLERIGDYVGHASTYMTDRYRHLLRGHEEEAALAFDAYLTGARTGAQAVSAARLTRV